MLLTGEEIKIKRIEHKIKQKDLAIKLSITGQHLSEVENEKVEGIKARHKATEFFTKLELELKK